MGNIQKKDGFIFYKSFYDSINALDESMRLMNQCSLRFIRHLPSMV